MYQAPFNSSPAPSRQIFGTVPTLARRFNNPFSSGNQVRTMMNGNRNPMNRIQENLDLNYILSLYREGGPKKIITMEYRRNDSELEANFAFNPPQDIMGTELPSSLEYINEIQQIFLNYDRNNEEQTHKLVEFIETRIHTGLRELSTNIFLRPQKVKDYVYLYSQLSRNVKIIARHYVCCTPIFSRYLISEKICSDFEATQLSGYLPNTITPSYLVYFSDIINRLNCLEFKRNDMEIIEAFIDDDSEKLIEITSKSDFNFDIESYGGNRTVTLINLAAMYGAVNCFKYLMMNNPNLDDIANLAVVGGNIEIIRILMQAGISFDNSPITALHFRRDELFDWINSEISDETQDNSNNFAYAITDTLSIRAIYALTLTNDLIYANDWLSVFALDGMTDWCMEISKHTMFLNTLFFTLKDEEILNNLLEKTIKYYFELLFSEAVQMGYEFHIRVMAHHPNFDFFVTDMSTLLSLKGKFPDIYNEIQARTHAIVSAERGYQIFTHGRQINENLVFNVMKYCIKVNDSLTFMNLVQKYPKIDLSIDQLIELLKLSPVTWLFVASNVMSKQPDPSIYILLVRYYLRPLEESLLPAKIADIVLKDASLMEKLTPYDCINLFKMARTEISDFSPLIALFKKFNLISDDIIISESQPINELRSIVLNSPTMDKLIKNDIEGLVNVIPSNPHFIKKVIGCEVSKEFFDKILLLYIYFCGDRGDSFISRIYREYHQKSPEMNFRKIFANFLTNPVNKKYIDIKELCKSKLNAPFIELLEYSEEEFQYLKKIDFMRVRLMHNPNNARFFTLNQILASQNYVEITNSILTLPLTPDDVRKIENSYFIKHLPNVTRKIFMRDEICNGFSVRTILKYLYSSAESDEIFCKLLNTVLSRNLSDRDMADIFIKISTEQKAVDYVISRKDTINDSCLIIYSIRTSIQLVEKGTPIEDVYFCRLFSSREKFNYEALFEYTVSKTAIAHALINAIIAKNVDAIHFLISKGAPVNIILDSMTPLQTAISYKFVEGVKILLNYGASIGFNGLTTAAKASETSKNLQIVKLICSRIDVQYESHFENITSIHIPKAQISVKVNQNEDIFKISNLPIKSDNNDMKSGKIGYDDVFDFTICSDFQELLTGQKTIFFEGPLKLCNNFGMALNIIGLFAPLSNLSTLVYLMPSQISRRSKITNEIQTEIWKIIENFVSNSSPSFKAVYSVITGIDLIEPMPDLSYLLFIATRIGNLPIIKSLFDKGADINCVEGYYQFLSPSLEAISKDRSDILQLFIDNNLDVDQIYALDNYTLINASIEFSSVRCFDILVEKASLKHVVAQTPMMVALKVFEQSRNDYFINKLMDKIDIEYEKIVDRSFISYLEFRNGIIPEFVYLGVQRPVLTLNQNRNNFHRILAATDENNRKAQDLINSDIVQKKLAFEIVSRPYIKVSYPMQIGYVEDITPEDELMNEYDDK